MRDYIPDYNELFEDYEARQERQEKKLPKCDCCGERIVKEKFFNSVICRFTKSVVIGIYY